MDVEVRVKDEEDMFGQIKGKGHPCLGVWPYPKAVSEERRRKHSCLVRLRAEATEQSWE